MKKIDEYIPKVSFVDERNRVFRGVSIVEGGGEGIGLLIPDGKILDRERLVVGLLPTIGTIWVIKKCISSYPHDIRLLLGIIGKMGMVRMYKVINPKYFTNYEVG